MNEIRKYMEAAMGKLSPKRAQELARSVTKGEGKDQIARVARDLLEWSNKNRERLTDLVRTEVRSQLKQLGVASRDEVDSLRRRVRELERQGAPKKATARKATTKRSAAKPQAAAASA